MNSKGKSKRSKAKGAKNGPPAGLDHMVDDAGMTAMHLAGLTATVTATRTLRIIHDKKLVFALGRVLGACCQTLRGLVVKLRSRVVGELNLLH